MAHITRISRVPWTKPKNLLGCKTPPPRGKRESLFGTSEPLINGQFEDASPGRHGALLLNGHTTTQKEVAAQKEDAANGKEEHEDGTPTTLDASRLARADNGANTLDSEKDATDTHNTYTPSHAPTGRTPQGSCGMEALLLAAEHAVSPNPYRTKQRTPGTDDDFLKQQELSHVVGQTIPESMSTWHCYSLNGGDGGKDRTPSTFAGDKELESREHDHDDLPHTVTYGEEDAEEEEEEDYNSAGEDSRDNFDLYDQTVLVIRDGVPVYTVHQRPTPKKVVQDLTTSPEDDTDDKDNTNSGFTSFEERIAQIQDYKRAHGHLSKFTNEHKSLSGFISNQRSKYLRGLLNPARAKRLRALKVPGFEKEPMSVKEEAPNKSNKNAKKAGSQQKKKTAFNKQGDTQRQQKTTSSSRGKSKKSPVASIEPASKRRRTARTPEDDKKEEATPAKTKLEKTPPKKKSTSRSPPKKKFGKRGQPRLFVKWEERIVQLEKYQEEHGHTAVPANKKKNADGELGRWLAAQRSLHRKRQLKGERVQELRRLKCDGF